MSVTPEMPSEAPVWLCAACDGPLPVDHTEWHTDERGEDVHAGCCVECEVVRLRAALKRILDERPDGMLLDICEVIEMGSPGSHLALSYEPRAMALADDMDAMRRDGLAEHDA